MNKIKITMALLAVLIVLTAPAYASTDKSIPDVNTDVRSGAASGGVGSVASDPAIRT